MGQFQPPRGWGIKDQCLGPGTILHAGNTAVNSMGKVPVFVVLTLPRRIIYNECIICLHNVNREKR